VTVDLASRAVGGSVVAANDELFADRHNLIKPGPASHQPATFGPRGQIYDGWETRRRREPGHDWAIVRLGLPGVVHAVTVDTAWFTGNYPPEVSVEGCGVEGYPSPTELQAAAWMELVPRSPVAGDTANELAVKAAPVRVTHVRLSIYPDGGVARLRVRGEPVADPRLICGDWMDLAALAHGGEVTDCSNRFYASPSNLIAPGPAQVMGEGWETARRRDGSNDWLELRLAGPGTVQLAELDTTHFLGNAPGWASLRGWDRRRGDRPDAASGAGWVELLAPTRLQPDTRHLFRVAAGAEVTDARLDVYPDGGMARLRLHGRLGADGRKEQAGRWWSLLPPAQAAALGGGASVVEIPSALQPQLFAFPGGEGR
jgi:allantoicase